MTILRRRIMADRDPRPFRKHPLPLLLVSVLLVLISVACADPKDAPVNVLEGFTYSGRYLDVSPVSADTRATHWKPDGTMIFVVGRATGNVAVYEMEEPWDISTAKLKSNVRIAGAVVHGIYLRADGTRMWIFDRTRIWDYQLEEAWDVATRDEGTVTSFQMFARQGHDIDFKPDGSVLFVDDRIPGTVFAIALEEPWEIPTGRLEKVLDIRGEQVAVRGIEFIDDGAVMLLLDTGRSEILQYNLSVPYDIETAEFTHTFDLSAQTRNPRGLSLSSDRKAFYVTCTSRGHIFQYIAGPDAEDEGDESKP